MPKGVRLIDLGLGALAGAVVLFTGYAALSPEPISAMPAQAANAASGPQALETAIFAGGCFWCVESAFDAIPGVTATTSGFTGGTVVNPSYNQVGQGGTGHTEAVQVTFDPKKVSYEKLLYVFWRNVDPVDAGGQFCDRGAEYRTGIFVHGTEQRRLALASRAAAEAAKKVPGAIVTEITDAGPFYPAEDYHQDYHLKNPVKYKFYRYNCGRDARLDTVWGVEARGGAETH